MGHRTAGAFVALLPLLGTFAARSARADIPPGTDVSSAQLIATETDRCGGHTVRVTSGTHLSGATALTNTSDVAVYAIHSQDVNWTCDGSKEHTRCPATANLIRVKRGADRLLTTQCLNYAPPAPPAPPPRPGTAPGTHTHPDVSGARVLATETDRCGRHGVRITVGTKISGPDVLVNGSHDEAVFSVMTPEIAWTCEEGSSTSSERTRCPYGTNLIKVHRGADRLVSTTCMKLPEHAVPTTSTEYRRTRGYSFVNSTPFQTMVGGYSFDDLTEIYGKCETHIFGCAIPDPMALAFLGIMNAALKTGQCFGFSLSSLMLGNGGMPLSAFPSYDGTDENRGAATTDVWHLTGPSFTSGTNISPKLSHYIHLNHMLQLSSESLHEFIGSTLSLKTPEGLRNSALAALRNGGGVVSVHSGTHGHAMALYQVTPLANGAYGLDVYNPNVPYTAAESDPSKHADALGRSRITVTSDGHFTLPSSRYKDGPMTSIAVMPYSLYKSQQHLPTSLQGLGALVFGGIVPERDGVVTHAQITDAHGHTMLAADGSVNTDPRTRIPGAAAVMPFGDLKPGARLFALDGNGTYTHTMTGNGQGTYAAHFAGRHVALELHGIPSHAGEQDTLTLDGNSAAFEFKTSAATKSFHAKLHARTADGSVRIVSLQGTGFKDASVRVQFDAARETIVYTHAGGPATLTFALSATHRTGPSDVTAAPVAVEAGDTVTLRPAWTQLHAAPGTLHLKKRGGAETSRPIK